MLGGGDAAAGQSAPKLRGSRIDRPAVQPRVLRMTGIQTPRFRQKHEGQIGKFDAQRPEELFHLRSVVLGLDAMGGGADFEDGAGRGSQGRVRSL
jgi:hypothetical protein